MTITKDGLDHQLFQPAGADSYPPEIGRIWYFAPTDYGRDDNQITKKTKRGQHMHCVHPHFFLWTRFDVKKFDIACFPLCKKSVLTMIIICYYGPIPYRRRTVFI